MFSKVYSAGVRGIEGYCVQVEADISDGMPQFLMVGYLASEVKEAADRVRTAMRNTGITLPVKRITVNLAPACVRKAGTRFDLPVAAALLGAMRMIPAENLQGVVIAGELSLNGQVLEIPGTLSLVEAARKEGIRRCIVPRGNASEGAVIKEVKVFGVASLQELMELLWNPESAKPVEVDTEELLRRPGAECTLDFTEINGQAFVRRAAEVAAAGMHNLLLIGPPGSGKTMIAKRIPGILPPLSLKESLEISKIYSIAGLLPKGEALMVRRPFRAPHHTATPEALAGGGRIPMPGEVSLSSRGVLFLDELPEFHRGALEILRQPLEEHQICVSRAAGTFIFPAEFMLVAAMNPCACGYYPDRNRCRCAQPEITRYLGRISQPLLDRIDICTEAPRISYEELSGRQKNESSAAIRKRVLGAWEIQRERYRGRSIAFNSRLDRGGMEEFCPLGRKEQELLKHAFVKLNLSARAYHKIIRVARTIADLEEEERILSRHIMEAVCYRAPDKKFWMEQGGVSMEEMEKYWHWLCVSLFPHRFLMEELTRRMGTPRAVFEAEQDYLVKEFPEYKEKLGILCLGRECWDFDGEEGKIREKNIRFLSREHQEFPRRLKKIPDSPGGIFVKGMLPEEEAPSLAIVGARNCSAYGRNLALQFAEELSRVGVQIISGMARGVDGFGHRGALRGGGKTFAVLGGGVDICYPKGNRDIYEEMERRGGLISEVPPGMHPARPFFPMRNRLISGFSDAVLIIEAKARSGSLITADQALEQGKELYAVPGRLGESLSEGCNRLIYQGAGLALSPEHLAEDLGCLPEFNRKKGEKKQIRLETSENLVYSGLGLQARNLEEISLETGLSLLEVMQILVRLELKGCVKEVQKNYYTKTGIESRKH